MMWMLMNFSYLKVIILVSFFIPFMVSCNDDSGNSLYDDWENVLDNNGARFIMDKDGHWLGKTTQGKEDMMKTLVGYGWQCYDTWEINPDGRRQKQSYWKDLIGVSPVQYYFNLNGTVRKYFISDAFSNGGHVYRDETWEYKDYDAIKRSTERIIFGNNEDDYLQVIGWSRDVFCAIQYLGVRSQGQKVYGVSLYRRMTDKQLADYNKKYKNIKDVINH